MKNGEIIAAIEEFAPCALQESWDNTGLQLGARGEECTGVLVCVDCTPAVVAEAIERRCNLIISHHPLIFKGLRSITGATPVERAVMEALRNGISIYSSHTALDSTLGGVSHEMARRLGIRVERALLQREGQDDPAVGLGIAGNLEKPVTAETLIARIKKEFGSPVVRHTAIREPGHLLSRIALCGGSGGEFIPRAVAGGAEVYINSDTRYHDFVDYQNEILILDIGHFESEQVTKDIFYHIITQKFANFAVYKSTTEKNPINYS